MIWFIVCAYMADKQIKSKNSHRFGSYSVEDCLSSWSVEPNARVFHQDGASHIGYPLIFVPLYVSGYNYLRNVCQGHRYVENIILVS